MVQNNTHTRRLKHTLIAALLATALPTGGAYAQNSAPSTAVQNTAVTIRVDHEDLGRLHWQFACQTAVFQKMTFFDMIDALHAQVVHHLELAPGQTLSADRPGITVGPDMDPEGVAAVIAKLKSVRMDVVSYQADALGRDPAADRKTFAFAKALSVKNIVGDPAGASLPALDALATEYGVSVAIRNGIKPAPHWDPAALGKTLAGRSPHIGACADLANWQRSGLDPLKGLQTLGPRVTELHLDDADRRGREAVLGTGAVGLPPILAWLQAQKFAGVFMVGYDTGGGPVRTQHWAASVSAFADALAALPKTGP